MIATGMGMGTLQQPQTLQHTTAKKKDGAKYLSKHINSLTTVPAGKDTYKGWLDELKERPNSS
jgi:hypothetical protein